MVVEVRHRFAQGLRCAGEQFLQRQPRYVRAKIDALDTRYYIFETIVAVGTQALPRIRYGQARLRREIFGMDDPGNDITVLAT